MKPLIFNLGASEALFQNTAIELDAECGSLIMRNFPDGETYLRIENNCHQRQVILVCSLDNPNIKTLAVVFATETLHSLGAKTVGLIAPYLAYMRQDKQFHPGECVSSRYYAGLLSHYLDWMITVDPHLHRIHDLNEIYTIPTHVTHAAPVIADWVSQHCPRPLLIGPDDESRQWVADIANRIEAPHLVLEKIRTGDREVQITAPNIDAYPDHTPVLADDIISSGQTMIEAIRQIAFVSSIRPVCLAVHALFNKETEQALYDNGAQNVISTNSIAHASNEIDIACLFKSAVLACLDKINDQ